MSQTYADLGGSYQLLGSYSSNWVWHELHNSTPRLWWFKCLW